MQLYSKEALQLILDQVNRDNPNLAIPVSDANVAIKGTVRATGSGAARNSSVTFVGKPGGGYRGELTLTFDRVNMSQLYPSTDRVTLYLPTSGKTLLDSLPLINNALGLNLTTADLDNPAMAMVPNATATAYNIRMHTTSPAFIGWVYINVQSERQGFYPKSGPGTKYLLFGDTGFGYFGVVDTTEMFTKVEAMTAVFGKLAYPRYGSTEGWFKFFYQGKVIYIPVEPIGNNVSWEAIYNANAMYGIDGVGKYPTSTPVNQSKTIENAKNGKRYYLRPRTPRASLTEPDAYFVGTPGQGNYAGTELDLLSRLFTGGQWGSNSGSGWGQWCIFQDTISNNVQTNFRLSTMAARNWSVGSKSALSFYWLPVFELVDLSTEIVPLAKVSGKLEFSVRPIPSTSKQDESLFPVSMGVPKTADFQPVAASGQPNTFELHPMKLGVPKTADYQPIAATSGNYEIKKSNLSNANGELNGFKR